MPIVLQPAAPFSPSISTAAGETDQFTRLAPLLEQHQQAVAQAYAQQRQQGMQFAAANADRMQQGSQFAAAQEQQRQLQEASLGQQAAQQDAQRQQQQAQHEQQIQAQLDMQRNEFTYKDQLELQRYKNGLSEIENSPNLTPEERGDMRLQFATKIDPMERKLAQSKLQQQAAQTQQLHQHLAEQDIIAKDRAAFMAGNLQNVTRDITDSEGNKLGSFTIIPGEKPHFIDTNSLEELRAARIQRIGELKQRDADRAEKATADREQRDEARMRDYQHKTATYAADLRNRIAEKFDAWAEKNKDNPDVKGAREARDAWIDKDFTAAMKEYEARNPPPKTGGGTSPETDFPKGAPDQPPIADTGRPTPAQSATLQDMNAVRAAFDAVPRDQGRPHPEEGEATAKLQRAESLFRKYGDPLNMPEATRREYLESLNAAVASAKKFSARTTPQPRKPGYREDEKGNLVPDEAVPFGSIRRRDGSLMRVLK